MPSASPFPQGLTISKGDVPPISFSLPQGFVVHIYAKDLGTPRDLQFTPGGTLLVSDPSAGRIIALPDKNGDGVADEAVTIAKNIPHAHGLAFSSKLLVAGLNALYQFDWEEKTLQAKNREVVFSYPANNDHNNRTVVVDRAGNILLSLGSSCDVCQESPNRGGSVLIHTPHGQTRVYARGLRNAAFLAIQPVTGKLWGTEMGRDNLGDNVPPDEINIIEDSGDYGWPNCYGERIPDRSFNHNSDCAKTIPPVYEFPAHSAPLGLTFIDSSQFPAGWQDDLLVALHGSWNRTITIGYKVVHLKIEGGKVVSSEDFMSGFNLGTQKEDSLGRPVDLAFDTIGNLYVSDDKAGVVYIIQKLP